MSGKRDITNALASMRMGNAVEDMLLANTGVELGSFDMSGRNTNSRTEEDEEPQEELWGADSDGDDYPNDAIKNNNNSNNNKRGANDGEDADLGADDFGGKPAAKKTRFNTAEQDRTIDRTRIGGQDTTGDVTAVFDNDDYGNYNDHNDDDDEEAALAEAIARAREAREAKEREATQTDFFGMLSPIRGQMGSATQLFSPEEPTGEDAERFEDRTNTASLAPTQLFQQVRLKIKKKKSKTKSKNEKNLNQNCTGWVVEVDAVPCHAASSHADDRDAVDWNPVDR